MGALDYITKRDNPVRLPSQFQIGDAVTITPPPGEFLMGPQRREVIGIHFSGSKVSYDLRGADGVIPQVDSCDVVPA